MKEVVAAVQSANPSWNMANIGFTDSPYAQNTIARSSTQQFWGTLKALETSK